MRLQTVSDISEHTHIHRYVTGNCSHHGRE